MEEKEPLEEDRKEPLPGGTAEEPDAVSEAPAPAEDGKSAEESEPPKEPAPKSAEAPAAEPKPKKAGEEKPAEPEKPDAPEDPEAALKRWIAEDAAAFVEAYPEADLAKLDGDARFRRFCGSRYGREPLKDLYADWLEITGTAAREAAARSASKSERSTGTGGGAGADTLTAAQQRDLDEWNRSYPNMKMTAKEYLSR